LSNSRVEPGAEEDVPDDDAESRPERSGSVSRVRARGSSHRALLCRTQVDQHYGNMLRVWPGRLGRNQGASAATNAVFRARLGGESHRTRVRAKLGCLGQETPAAARAGT